MTPTNPSRYFNPWLLWTDVALKTSEMLLSSQAVIQQRTQRMLAHGLNPSPADLLEIEHMGTEKITALGASGAAMVRQLHTTQHAVVQRHAQQWAGTGAALLTLMCSVTPAQAQTRGEALLQAGGRAVAASSQLSSAGARVMQRALKPLHAKVTDNARRLAGA